MIKLFSTRWCPYCVRAKNLLDSLGLEFEEIDIDREGLSREQLCGQTGMRTVPQIIIHGTCIGGYDDLYELKRSGELFKLLDRGDSGKDEEPR